MKNPTLHAFPIYNPKSEIMFPIDKVVNLAGALKMALPSGMVVGRTYGAQKGPVKYLPKYVGDSAGAIDYLIKLSSKIEKPVGFFMREGVSMLNKAVYRVDIKDVSGKSVGIQLHA